MDIKIKPTYYSVGKKQLFDVYEETLSKFDGVEGAYISNVLKYVYRCKEKNGVEDLRKAQRYLERLIQYEKEVTK